LDAQLLSMVGGPIARRRASWARELPLIEMEEQRLHDLSDRELKKLSLSLRYRAKSGEPLAKLLPETFALVREASKRTLKMRHYDVQVLGGMAMYHGCVAEMATGEGKTLTATLTLSLRALPGKGVHMATVNDYLAKRDSEWMAPVYNMLGLSVGVIQTEMNQDERRENYACDITYGTAKEFGFDFLRDRLLIRRIQEQWGGLMGAAIGRPIGHKDEKPVQREHYAVLVDEADSVLIDDARTPLIISAIPGEAENTIVACYSWAYQVVGEFVEDEHYEFDHDKKSVELSVAGRQLVRSLTKPEELDSVGFVDLYQFVERAIRVEREFHRDQQYVVRDGEIVIVDESTGRLAEGRKWRDGTHQAVEAKEGVEVTVDSGQAARVTVQDYFQRYREVCGMTGTASTSSAEILKVYRMRVVPIPTNRPTGRTKLPTRIFGTAEAKWIAIANEIRELNEIGRPVLVGTRTIDTSVHLSRLLEQLGIRHQVLNAHQVEAEAEIVAEAGQRGRVTVSTNMAGRGTDIKLGESVHELGGLHVICTEIHDSKRIDRQLEGRCGRQGDPGTVRQFLSLDDEIIASGFGPSKGEKLVARGLKNDDHEFAQLEKTFRAAQRRVEKRQFQQRTVLLHQEKQLKKMYREMGQDPYLDSSH
jgi:preprotein translocase subunit SecA